MKLLNRVAFFMLMKLELLYQTFLSSTGITTDSRHCIKGSVFFALKGDNFDGNKYAERALDMGCSFVVVDNPDLVKDQRYFLVDDVLTALQELARTHRRHLAVPIIGITGSNGKTTTKELLAAVLKDKFKLHYTQGNFNNHIGVPLTLLQLKPEHQMAIVEMGANHPGEIAELCKIAEPDMGIITNIGKAHLEGFGGLDGVINTKKELFDFVRNRKGKVFVNAKDELLMELSTGIDRLLYEDFDSEFEVTVEEALPLLVLKVTSASKKTLIKTHLAGEYNRINMAAALEIGAALGVDLETMKKGLESYIPTNNRSQIIEKGQRQIILDAYNANPASMTVAIQNFIKLKAKRKIVFLGAMKELGVYSKEEHQNIVDMLSVADIDRVVLVGEEFLCVDDKPDSFEFYHEPEQLIQIVKDEPLGLFLIKGSRSMKMERLLDAL